MFLQRGSLKDNLLESLKFPILSLAFIKFINDTIRSQIFLVSFPTLEKPIVSNYKLYYLVMGPRQVYGILVCADRRGGVGLGGGG